MGHILFFKDMLVEMICILISSLIVTMVIKLPIQNNSNKFYYLYFKKVTLM